MHWFKKNLLTLNIKEWKQIENFEPISSPVYPLVSGTACKTLAMHCTLRYRYGIRNCWNHSANTEAHVIFECN